MKRARTRTAIALVLLLTASACTDRGSSTGPGLADYSIESAALARSEITGTERAAAALPDDSFPHGPCENPDDWRVYDLPRAAGRSETEGPFLAVGGDVRATAAAVSSSPAARLSSYSVTFEFKAPGALAHGCSVPPDVERARTPLAGGCFARLSAGTSHLDVCTGVHAIPVMDEVAYSLEAWVAASAREDAVLREASIRSHEVAGSRWFSWTPRSDAEIEGCRPEVLTASSGSATVRSERIQCGTWDIDKGEPPGAFATTWRGRASGEEREAAFIVGVRSEKGPPAFTLNASFTVAPG